MQTEFQFWSGPEGRCGPFFKYFGGKYRITRKRLYPAPVFDHIIEPFAGGAGYSLQFPSRKVTLVDLDERVIQLWNYLFRVSETEILSLPNIEPSSRVSDIAGLTEEQRLLMSCWVSQTAFKSKMPSVEYLRDADVHNFWCSRTRHRIARNLHLIRHWEAVCSSYQDIDTGSMKATWFVDPPYQVLGGYYKHSNKEISFQNLSRWCQSLRGQVIVCEQEGAGWLPFEFVGEIHSFKSKHRGECRSREVAWIRNDGSRNSRTRWDAEHAEGMQREA